MLNGNRFNLKGVAWFGFETANYCVHGLWAVDYHSLIDFMKDNGFNGLRLPFSVELANSDKEPASINFYKMNEDLKGLSSLNVMDKIISACADAGILVMLDMHSLEPDGYLADGLWYDSKYSADDNLKAWRTMADRYKGQWNVVAADIFNEPFDGTWGTGDTQTDFNRWCQIAGNALHEAGTNWLAVCQGVANSPSCSDACFWGEDLQGVKTNPVQLVQPNKVVYSPHVYGPSVAVQKYFNDPSFPDNMPAIWRAHWSFIREMNASAITVGEWGGSLSGSDGRWMNAFVDYLIQIDAPDTWYWCLNPDSGDTGGLLDNDWKTPEQAKLDLLSRLQPNPTKVRPQEDRICVEFA